MKIIKPIILTPSPYYDKGMASKLYITEFHELHHTWLCLEEYGIKGYHCCESVFLDKYYMGCIFKDELIISTLSQMELSYLAQLIIPKIGNNYTIVPSLLQELNGIVINLKFCKIL